MPLRRPAVLLVCALALALASCGGGDAEDTAGNAESGGGFPVTITNGEYGSTTIPERPRRVVTLGWSDQDVVLALGVKLVGVVDIGGDFPNGVGPWATKQLGDAKPEVVSLADGVPYEKIAELRPDLVLAVQGELTKDDFDRLSKLAPTVTYAKGRKPYLSPWQEQTEIIGKALGEPAKARALVGGTERRLREAKTRFPALDRETFDYLYSGSDGSTGLYLRDEPRVTFLRDLGMRLSAGQDALTRDTKDNFYTEISQELLPRLDGDVLVAWFATDADQKAFTSSAVFRQLPAVKRGGFVPLGLVQAQAQGAPTVLSIPWAIDNVVPLIERGAEGKAD